MAKYVPDIKTRRWVVISQQRIKRPEGIKKGMEKKCPFCPGNESITPSEVYRIGVGKMKNGSSWKVRVVPNKYSITDIHEIIIHSPDHNKNIESLPVSQVELILFTYRFRYQTLEKNGQVMIYCNHGEFAGVSLRHPHSQLVVIPRQINLDTLVREPLNNIVSEYRYFTVYCPDFSQWPYEVWIVPKEENTTFGQIEDEELKELATILKQILTRLTQIYQKHAPAGHKELAYNYYIYHGQNWYLRIIPRLVHRAGFELGTGLLVNIVDPVNAAEELKK